MRPLIHSKHHLHHHKFHHELQSWPSIHLTKNMQQLPKSAHSTSCKGSATYAVVHLIIWVSLSKLICFRADQNWWDEKWLFHGIWEHDLGNYLGTAVSNLLLSLVYVVAMGGKIVLIAVAAFVFRFCLLAFEDVCPDLFSFCPFFFGVHSRCRFLFLEMSDGFWLVCMYNAWLFKGFFCNICLCVYCFEILFLCWARPNSI